MANVKATDLIDFTRASTGTYLDSDGTLKTAANNIPRIEYDADGNLLGLLVEEARTNLLRGSEAFDNAEGGFWSISQMLAFGSGSTANATTAPNGTLTADLLVPAATSSNSHWCRQNKEGLTVGNDYTMSVYVKAAGYTTCSLRIVGTDAPIANFDLSAGTTNQSAATITNVGNGWYRCTLTGEATSTTVWHYIYPNQQATFTGDGTSGIYVWGAQLEAGSFPTSYMKTQGSTVSRSADVASIDVDQFGYNQSEGTVVQEFSTADTFVANENAFSDGTNNNRIMWGLNSNAGRAPYISSGGANTVALTNNSGISGGVQSKLGIAFALNDVASSLDGGSIATDTSATIPSAITTLYLGVGATGTGTFINGHIKSLTYTPKRLSNAKLQELTS